MPHVPENPFRRCIGRLLVAGLLLLCGNAIAASGSPAYRVVGYTTGWNANEDAQLDRIDTLIFAFAHVANGRVVLDPASAATLDRITALKAKHPGLKVVVSVGGWGAGGFSEAAATASGRRAFADSAAQGVSVHQADGIDVDWEYPGHGESGIHSSPQDRVDFTLLLKAVRGSLDRIGARDGRTGANHYTLSAAVADGPFVSGVDIAAVAPLLDWFNLMTYDFVNSMTATTGHHTGLHPSLLAPDDARTLDRAVRQFLAAGAPPDKLLIGVAMYGREFDDVQAAHDGLYQKYGRYGGEHPWPQLEHDFIGHNGFERHWDAVANAPWLWNPRTRTFITYDDPESIAAKAAYVKAQHLGGIMYWEQQQDPDGELLDAIWRGLRQTGSQDQRN